MSYLVGMTMAGVAARHLLGAPYLLHVSNYAESKGVVFNSANRPDLFGPIGPSQWLVIEAKGRTNAPSAGGVSVLHYSCR